MISLKRVIELIELKDEISKKVLSADEELNLNDYKEEIKGLQSIETAEAARNSLVEKLAPDNGNIKILTVMLNALRYTHANYLEKGISEKVFVDTLKAYTRFIEEQHEIEGIWAFNRDWWSYRQNAMSIFRIGELEYEMKDINEKYISVHIPSDAKITKEKVKESLIESFHFFKKYYPEYYKVKYYCKTWLLSSDLKNILPKESNLINFINIFDIDKEEYNSTSFMTWIYKKDANNDLEDLPKNTTLQRNLKAYLKEGNSISTAEGYINFDKVGIDLEKI